MRFVSHLYKFLLLSRRSIFNHIDLYELCIQYKAPSRQWINEKLLIDPLARRCLQLNVYIFLHLTKPSHHTDIWYNKSKNHISILRKAICSNVTKYYAFLGPSTVRFGWCFKIEKIWNFLSLHPRLSTRINLFEKTIQLKKVKLFTSSIVLSTKHLFNHYQLYNNHVQYCSIFTANFCAAKRFSIFIIAT